MQRTAILLIVLVAFAGRAATQDVGSRPGGVTGSVRDSADRPLANVRITATDVSGKAVATVRSGSTGLFAFDSLPSRAKYTFAARRIGFAESVTEPMTVPDTGSRCASRSLLYRLCSRPSRAEPARRCRSPTR